MLRPRPLQIAETAAASGLLVGMTLFAPAALMTYLSGDSLIGPIVLGVIAGAITAGASAFDDLRKTKGPWS
jgi:VIT1/CCC1 family predicted Fe2+/Mn2+ transporter